MTLKYDTDDFEYIMMYPYNYIYYKSMFIDDFLMHEYEVINLSFF